MELNVDIHIAVKFVVGCGEDPREALGLWSDVTGKKAVGGRLMSLNGGSILNPVGVMSTSGVTSPTVTKAEEIVGYNSWTNLMLKDFNIEFVWAIKLEQYS